MSTNTKRTRFSRRLPDHVTDELVSALSKPVVYEFNQLFAVVYENLKLRNAVSGGEEMLRLRAYEKLQGLVSRGLVERTGMAQEKRYRGLENIKLSQIPPPMPIRQSVVLEAVRKVAAEEAEEARIKAEEEVIAAAAAEKAAAEAAEAAEVAEAAAVAAAAEKAAEAAAAEKAKAKAKPAAKATAAKAEKSVKTPAVAKSVKVATAAKPTPAAKSKATAEAAKPAAKTTADTAKKAKK